METAYGYIQRNGVDGDQPAHIIGRKLGAMDIHEMCSQ